MKKVLLIMLLALIGLRTNAQITFQKIYGGYRYSCAFSVQKTTDGGYIMVGYIQGVTGDTTSVYLVKTNVYGDTLWTRTFGENNESEGKCVQQTTDGGYVIVGETQDFGAGYYDVYLIKTNSSGDTLWTRTYGGIGRDEGWSVQQTTDGGYIIAGETSDFGAPINGYNAYLIKTNANGDTLWTKAYGNGAIFQMYAFHVQQTSDGGYILCGSILDTLSNNLSYLLKTNSVGDELWFKTFFAGIESVQQTTDGGYIMTGPYGKVLLLKTNAFGDTLWTRAYGGTGVDGGQAVEQTSDGGYIIAGQTGSFGAQYAVNLYLIKTNANGDTLWSRVLGSDTATNFNNPQDNAMDVHQTTDGGYIIAGRTVSFGDGEQNFYLIKTDSLGYSGCNEWQPATVQSMTNTIVGSLSFRVFNGAIINSHLANVGRGGIVTDLCQTTGINEITNNNSISIYPNPTSGTFTLSYNSQLSIQNSQLKIYDVLGQEVYTQAITNPNQTSITISQLSNGVYFYQVTNGKETYRGKFVKE